MAKRFGDSQHTGVYAASGYPMVVYRCFVPHAAVSTYILIQISNWWLSPVPLLLFGQAF